MVTAAGQIMRKWEYPKYPTRTLKGQTCSVNSTPGRYDMIGGTYDWANMPYDPAKEANLAAAQRKAIGMASISPCRDLIAAEMRYNCGMKLCGIMTADVFVLTDV